MPRITLKSKPKQFPLPKLIWNEEEKVFSCVLLGFLHVSFSVEIDSFYWQLLHSTKGITAKILCGGREINYFCSGLKASKRETWNLCSVQFYSTQLWRIQNDAVHWREMYYIISEVYCYQYNLGMCFAPCGKKPVSRCTVLSLLMLLVLLDASSLDRTFILLKCR